MFATTFGRRSLAMLALVGLAGVSAVAQQPANDGGRYRDRQYAPRETAPVGQERADVEQRPQYSDGAVRDDGSEQRRRDPVQLPFDDVERPAGNARQGASNGPVAEGNRPANGQARPNAQLQPAAPFQLNAQQQRFVDELLAAWEKHSAGIKTFECEFTRWEYSPNFGPVNANGQLGATAISSGLMKYIKPDKGLFQVTETRVFNQQTGKYDKVGADVGEHWVCDGKVVWEVDHKAKQVKEHPIPPEMQGEQIANGPLPFMLFGGEAAKLKARYFMREQTDPQFAKEEIWLESYPRWSGDAANYRSAHLIMKRADFLPYALRLYATNGADYTVFEFRKIKLNNVFMRDIAQPKIPSGYQLVRAEQQTAQQPPAGPPR
ncbi:MAG: hypothetical protein DCC68_24220 [Planctomycetota bacterium]|nr:MAG: hypothetical protein DCC68_24220 [Planctomycetota bacterium]